MFTGIIEEVGMLRAVRDLGGGRRLTVAASFASELTLDQSVAVNGACQTVVAANAETFVVVAVEETLQKTTLGSLMPGAPLNLERAMRPTSRLDGHLVQGHVDATGTVAGVEQKATSWLYRVRFDPPFAPYLVPAGSVAVDGISLTVARLEGSEFTVSIIPHTYALTNVQTWTPDTRVNLEFDLIGKYVVRALSLGSHADAPKLTPAGLREQGY